MVVEVVAEAEEAEVAAAAVAEAVIAEVAAAEVIAEEAEAVQCDIQTREVHHAAEPMTGAIRKAGLDSPALAHQTDPA